MQILARHLAFRCSKHQLNQVRNYIGRLKIQDKYCKIFKHGDRRMEWYNTGESQEKTGGLTCMFEFTKKKMVLLTGGKKDFL